MVKNTQKSHICGSDYDNSNDSETINTKFGNKDKSRLNPNFGSQKCNDLSKNAADLEDKCFVLDNITVFVKAPYNEKTLSRVLIKSDGKFVCRKSRFVYLV